MSQLTGGAIGGGFRAMGWDTDVPALADLVNRLFSDAQQWTGQRTSLEDQAIKASDQSPELLVKNLGAIPYYQEQHRKIFGTDLNPEGVAKAIAAYERTILSGNSPFDRFNAGDKKACRQPRSEAWLYSKERHIA